MKRLVAVAIVAYATGSAGFASERCDVPVADWQPRKVLQAKLESDGWKVRSIRTEDGCYEAFAINAEGENVAAFFNPKSLEILDTKIEH
ncbi:PepSY domain-containing protein [Rhizobium lemnae]|uniref:PepSY domain-containing protein n=1 Tax=Rhizobium lemnae TaxID=1214924 RepID=A0ABV8EE78_9HYPH|nr:PepSY domain-containing protein [Rhizobium lemnae]MCJ8510677.1 PepSY domain-containing protein [Rhizobium lemnae]